MLTGDAIPSPVGTSFLEDDRQVTRLIFSITLLFSILPSLYGCTDHSPPSKKPPAATYHGQGKRLFHEKKFKEAIDKWSKQLEINPKDPNVLNNIGIAHHELGNYQIALEYHNKALEINQGFAHSYYDRGRAYLSLKNYDLAEQDFKKAIELKWDLSNSYYNLLVVYKNKKDCKKAEMAFGKLRELRTFVKEGEQELIGCYLSSGKGDKAVELLAEGLKSNDPDAHGYAIRKLGETKHPSAVDPLIRVLITEHSYPAANALANIGTPAIKSLEAALKSEDRQVRRVALTALDNISDLRATDSLVLGLRDEDPGLRSLSASALGRKQDPRALGPLAEVLRDEDPAVRKWAVKSLGDIKSTGHHPVEGILPLLKDADKDVRISTIETLGKLQDVRAVQPLVEIVKESDIQQVRKGAMTALGQIRNQHALEPLLALVKDEDPMLRMWAVDALGEIGDARALEPAIVLLGDQNTNVRQSAAEALGKIRDSGSVGSLIRTLQKDTWVKPQAAKALGEIRDLRGVEPLIAALQTHHPIRERFNRKLMSSFPSHGEGSVVVFLVMAPFASMFKDNAPSIRENACKALGKLKDPRSVQSLVDALKDKEFMVRKSAADALVEINDPKTADYLAPLLKRKDAETRDSAMKVLKRLNEERSSP